MPADPAAEAAFAQTDTVIDALPRAVLVADPDGMVVGWNAVAERVIGWSRAEAVGRSVAELLASLERDIASVLAHAAAEGDWRGDLTLVDRYGEPVRLFLIARPLVAGGEVVGVVAMADEVTEQRVLEQQARDLTEHLRLALDAGGLGTWRWDLATGEVTWDETMERLFGLAPGTFPGTYEAWAALQDPEELRRSRAVVDAAMVSREPYTVEHRIEWPDGSVHWLQGRGRVTVGADGAVTGAIGCTADITARKRAELDAERRAREHAEQAAAERLARARLAFLGAISDAALVHTEPTAFLRAVAADAVPQLGDWCIVHVVEPDGRPTAVAAHADPDRVTWLNTIRDRIGVDPEGIWGVPAVLRSGETQFLQVDEAVLEQLATHLRPDLDPAVVRAVLDELHLTSVITVPLRTRNGVIGALQFVSAESGRRYRDDDVALAEAAAGRVAAAVENLRVLHEQRHIAATLQAALLPPALPPVPGATLASRYWPAGASEAGGDFYDVFPLGPTRWAVVIGDVCGKGADSAAVTSIARHTIRAAARHGVEPVGVLDWLNQAVIAGQRGLFCTVVYATLDALPGDAWRLTVASGGHPFPVVARADGTTGSVGRRGTLIGVFPELRTRIDETVLGPGDTVVLYTDGVTDLPPPHGLQGDEVRALVAGAAAGAPDADAVARRLGERLNQALPVSARADDIALVVVHIDGAPAPV